MVDGPVTIDDPFPELTDERERLRYSRACRDEMIARFSSVDPDASADAFVVAPERLVPVLREALAGIGLRAADGVQDLAHDEAPIFTAEAVKGLEFDGVVVVNAHEILDGTPRGRRLLYVALTRAVQTVSLVGDALPPEVLQLG